jgi:hypothetical protein
MSMINIAKLTKRVAPGVRGHFLVSSEFALTAVVGIAQTMISRARPHSLSCIASSLGANKSRRKIDG